MNFDYLCSMFVRVKKNRSGSSSVLVVRKASGRYIVVKNLGVATDEIDEDYTLNKVYYYLDKLGSKQKNTVRRISVEHTRKILGGKIGLMFYDCTSLYFETSNEDRLRAKGFSKDGKTAESQIILGLLVSEDGYPLHYCIHRGDRHEGRTMIPAVNRFMKIFKLDKKDFIIVADAGLMSKDNVKMLKDNGYSYIIGARIKSETAKVKDWILSLVKRPDTYNEYTKGPCQERRVQP